MLLFVFSLWLFLSLIPAQTVNCGQFNGTCHQCVQNSNCGYCSDTKSCWELGTQTTSTSIPQTCILWNVKTCENQCRNISTVFCESSCLGNDGNCGWCSGFGMGQTSGCVAANSDRSAPAVDVCQVWSATACPNCVNQTSCNSCLNAQQYCGWCQGFASLSYARRPWNVS